MHQEELCCLELGDRETRDQAARTLRRVARTEPETLADDVAELLMVGRSRSGAVRTCVADLLRVVPLGEHQGAAVDLLREYVRSGSGHVKVAAAKALAELSQDDPALTDETLELVRTMGREEAVSTRRAAERLRGELESRGER